MMDDNLVQDPEIEYLDERETISVPFDPHAIKILTTPMTLGDLLDRIEHDEIKLDTEFQRKFVWEPERQSQFIESLLLRLPIPTFYFDGADDNKWRIIDGLQRISTVKRFVLDQSLALTGLEFLKQFEGKRFGDLPRDLQRRIKTFPITAYIVEKGTPDEVKYNIFSRINRGGLVLKPQEIRHALFQGNISDFIRELAEDEAFLTATSGKIKTDRMEDRDFITRFVSFYVLGYEQYTPDLDSFMSKGMGLLRNMPDERLRQIKADFVAAMACAFAIFGPDAFRKRLRAEDPRKPINKALFEALSVQLALLTPDQRACLAAQAERFKMLLTGKMNERKFIRSITQGTALRDTTLERHEEIREIINQLLG
jgi:hypothetical protein